MLTFSESITIANRHMRLAFQHMALALTFQRRAMWEAFDHHQTASTYHAERAALYFARARRIRSHGLNPFWWMEV